MFLKHFVSNFVQSKPGNEAGSVVPIVAISTLFLVAGAWVLSLVALDLGERSRAQSAADAAALAGVLDGADAALRAASANGSPEIHFSENGDGDVTVTATIDGHVAKARATREGVIQSLMTDNE